MRVITRTAILCGAVCIGMSVPSVSADDFYLVQGGKIEGVVQNPTQPADGKYVLEIPAGGRLVLAEQQVERVVKKSDLERRYGAMLPSVPDTEAGHLDMAERCRKARLDEQRLFHFEQVIRHNPDHGKARHALGYSLVDDHWVRQDRWMEELGYVRYRGNWRLPQELKLLAAQEKHDEAVISWKKKIKTWRSWIVKRRDNAGVGEAEIRAIRDPLAASSLATLLDKKKEHRQLRLLYVDVLGQLPSGDAIAAITKHSLQDADPRVRDACVEQLERTKPPMAVSAFIDSLQHEKNVMVNRAAVALARLRQPQATLPLIDALITEHKHLVGQSGGLRPMFSNQGGSGLSAGGKQEIKRIKQRNEPVLHALTALHVGVNFGFNQAAWKTWYISQKTPPPAHLRRGE
jgi:hypothetical protein